MKETALANSRLAPYIAEASKDAAYPITQDIMNTTIFPNSLFLQPSNILFDAPGDYRNSEIENFHVLTELLVDATALDKWVPRQTNTSLTDEQRKARRIWHKGAVLTWGPYLKDIIINTFNMMTEANVRVCSTDRSLQAINSNGFRRIFHVSSVIRYGTCPRVRLTVCSSQPKNRKICSNGMGLPHYMY